MPTAPLGAYPQAPSSGFNNSDILADSMAGSLKTQYQARQTSPPTIRFELPTRPESSKRQQEREPMAEAKRHSSPIPGSTAHGGGPSRNDGRRGTSDRIELDAESPRQIEVPRESRRTSLQPPRQTPSNRSWDSSPSSAMTATSRGGTYYDSSNVRDMLRAQRRARFNTESEPEDPIRQNRAFELPASTQRISSSRRVVRERGPLSDMEHKLSPRYLQPAYNGYASEEDVSQLGSSTVDYRD